MSLIYQIIEHLLVVLIIFLAICAPIAIFKGNLFIGFLCVCGAVVSADVVVNWSKKL